ncbi:phage antirepressor KilAC domain-containing protein [Komagataeibacter europaeus]|uniref:phage antirepressor KilAC domain-containing protein n=1 Tax=Komagataeibacter europaeus TaxID=33995 RepID=UPI0018DED801|nr:phage antirepressor KilAC domain-containing protein [Komagataeibacter europaeus]GBQ45023.1 phage-related DNA binding protein [Komagataeibacter europaeus LMG 18890]
MNSLTILSTEIRQDADGRYCLNDCHRAAGGVAKDAPGQWLRTDQAKKLIKELETMQNCTVSETAGKPVETVPGRNGGTYACKELVYAYAMWISAAFHLTVIRAFDAMVTGATSVQTPAIDLNDPAFLRSTLLTYTEKLLALEAEKAEAAPKLEAFERLANSKGRTNLREVGKELQIGSKRGIEFLREIKWTFRDQAGRWKAYAGAVDAGYVEMKYTTYTNTAGEEVSTQQVFVTPRGMARLAHRLGMQ